MCESVLNASRKLTRSLVPVGSGSVRGIVTNIMIMIMIMIIIIITTIISIIIMIVKLGWL